MRTAPATYSFSLKATCSVLTPAGALVPVDRHIPGQVNAGGTTTALARRCMR
jgi:hypothetical protein